MRKTRNAYTILATKHKRVITEAIVLVLYERVHIDLIPATECGSVLQGTFRD
jgi:hypothetical protein